MRSRFNAPAPTEAVAALPPYMRAMTEPQKSRPIELSGNIAALATTLGLPVSELRAAIGALIERGYLAPVGGGAWRLFPKPTR
jgi:hypothetical protein